MATLEVQISASIYDAMESAGTVTVDGAVLNVNGSAMYAGVTFLGLSDLAGSTINTAYIQFNFTSTSFDSPYASIRGYFYSAVYMYFEGGSNELSNRYTGGTTATITWDQNNIGTGLKNSPNVASILQEIINTSGWNTGVGAYRACFIIKGVDSTTEMRVTAYDGTPSLSAKLIVDYTPGDTTQTVSPSSVDSAESVGAAVVTPGAVTIAPSGIATLEAIGAAIIGRGAVTIGPPSIASAETFGAPTVTPGARTITPNGIGTAEAVGEPVVSSGASVITPAAIASAESIGVAVVTPDLLVEAGSAASGEAFGEPAVTAGGILAQSIAGAEAFGSAAVTPGAVTVAAEPITSTENVNGVTVLNGELLLFPDGIASAESVGTPELTDHRYVTTPAAGSDDAIEDAGGLVYLTTTSGNVNAAQPYAAFLFKDPPVPPGATVVHAYLRLYMFTYHSPALTVRLEANIAPAALLSTLNNISGRTLTETGVPWVGANIGVNQYNDSVDFGPVVQEVVNLPGWTASSSDLLIVLVDNGTGGHIRFNMTDNATDRPQLIIDYRIGDIEQTITAPGIASGEAVGEAVLTPGETLVVVSEGVVTAEAVGEPESIIASQSIVDAGEIATGFRLVDVMVIEGGPVVRVDDGIATAEAVGEASVVSALELTVEDGIATAEQVNEATVAGGALSVLPPGIGSAESLGNAALSTLATILPACIAASETSGAVEVAPGVIVVLASSVDSAESVGAALVTAGTWLIAPDGIASGAGVGMPELSPGSVVLSPSGVASGESFGGAVVTALFTVVVDGIASDEMFGSAEVLPGAVEISPDGIETNESIGEPGLTTLARIAPDGIASAEGVGAPGVIPGGVIISPDGIASAESLGAAIIGRGPIFILPDGMTSGAAFGVAALEVGPTVIAPSGILSAEAFGILVLMARFLPTVNIYRVPGKTRVYQVAVKGRVYVRPEKPRVYRVEE